MIYFGRLKMTKDELLELLQLLSALESWSFTGGTRLPDHMLEQLNGKSERIKEEILKP